MSDPLPSAGAAGVPPRGPKGFPLRYVCDMAAGFQTMVALQGEGVKSQRAFELAFDLPYKKSTVCDNHALWKAAAAIPGEQQRWIRFGQSERGEWTLFVRAMRAD